MLKQISGQKLYKMYEEQQLFVNNNEVDDWDDLPPYEQSVWEHLAEKVGVFDES